MNQNELARILSTQFDEKGLKELASLLGIIYESLPKADEASRIKSLAALILRHNRLPELQLHLGQETYLLEETPESLAPYLQQIAADAVHLDFDPSPASGPSTSRITLDQIFIPPMGARVLDTDRPPSRMQPRIRISEQSEPVLDVIQATRRAILLGAPGYGKSSVLRYLCFCLAKAALEPNQQWLEKLAWHQTSTAAPGHLTRQLSGPLPPIPVLLNLWHFAGTDFEPKSPTALWRYFIGQLHQRGMEAAVPVLERFAHEGRLFFLLDGVDELPLAMRAHIWQAVAHLSGGTFSRNRWLATCRPLSFVPWEAPNHVPAFMLLPTADGQIDPFVKQWYGALVESKQISESRANQMTRDLQLALQKELPRSLITNPMMLTALAQIHSQEGSLDDQPSRLYHQLIDQLTQWISCQQAEPGMIPAAGCLPSDIVESSAQLLYEVAYASYSEGGDESVTVEISDWDFLQMARKHLDSTRDADQLLEITERQAHVLISKGGQWERSFAFAHPSLHSYLAACYLTSQADYPSLAAQLAVAGQAWAEILRLATSILVFNKRDAEMASRGAAVVLPSSTPDEDDEAGWLRTYLGASMLAAISPDDTRGEPLISDVVTQARDELAKLVSGGRLSPVQRAAASDVLAELGDPRPGVCTFEPEMCFVAGGTFLMGTGIEKQPMKLAPFAIARYPTTNAQFSYFVADGGYSEAWRSCWTEEGWQYLIQGNWTSPRYWENGRVTFANRPVVGISWYEAAAYANWLGQKSGRDFRLPSEAEWERAARHTDGRQWPWGNQWRDGIVNSKEAGIGRPTGVGCFPASRAECGADDMSGNVWEWCSSRWQDESGTLYPSVYQLDDGREDLSGDSNVWRVRRGGAFHDDDRQVTSSFRNLSNPLSWGSYVGFRLAETL